MDKAKFQGILKTLGPGILFAGAAIGGSHLVQSTRAGADYGFSLLWIVILVLIFKYPFFEFSHRYTATTQKSILEGYFNLGRIPLMLFFICAVVVAIINAAAVTLVTASLAGNFLGIQLNIFWLSVVCVLIIGLILFLGKYPLLDKIMKIMVFILGLFTLIAVYYAFDGTENASYVFYDNEIWTLAGVSFLLALMGWMPAPLDVAVWPSLWALEREKETNYRPNLKEALFDFKFGYFGTGILAIAFVSLGALIMYNSGTEFSNSGIKFSGQLVNLYSSTLGQWSEWIISIVAFITMFSTSLTVFDGYTRTLKGSMDLLWRKENKFSNKWFFVILMSLMAASLLIIGTLLSGIKTLLDVATIIAFLTAPLFAILNYLVVFRGEVPEEYKPSGKLKLLSRMGIVFLSGFGLIYIYWMIFN